MDFFDIGRVDGTNDDIDGSVFSTEIIQGISSMLYVVMFRL